MAHDDAGSTDKQSAHKGSLDTTLNDLVPVRPARTDATQVMSDEAPIEGDTDLSPVSTTDRGLPPVPPTSTDLPPVPATSTDLPPVPTSTDLPPVEGTARDLPPDGGTVAALPPVHSKNALPHASEVTAPRLARAPAAKADPPRFEITPGRVALAGLGVSLLGVVIWLVWPLLTRPATPPPIEWVDAAPVQPAPAPAPAPAPRPAAKPVAPPTPAAPGKDELRLDAKTHVIDPRALHAPDVPLEPTHKYRLSLQTDDRKAGTVLARLEEAQGWGVLHAMATHHALQFGGARTLRLHCEPGPLVRADTTISLELVDLARKMQRKTLTLSPATQCFDFEVGRLLELEPGTSRRVQLRSEQKVALGEQVPLRVAYRVPVPGDAEAWRFGVLAPGDDVLVEATGARFAIIDPWLGDNDGEVVLDLLPGDTDSRGLARPDGSDAKFVPTRP
ncbi:MAG: hypothetical protein AB1730_04445 [Myxococcota bacterium]